MQHQLAQFHAVVQLQVGKVRQAQRQRPQAACGGAAGGQEGGLVGSMRARLRQAMFGRPNLMEPCRPALPHFPPNATKRHHTHPTG